MMNVLKIIGFIINAIFFGYIAIFGVYIAFTVNIFALKVVMLTAFAFAIGSAIIFSEESE